MWVITTLFDIYFCIDTEQVIETIEELELQNEPYDITHTK